MAAATPSTWRSSRGKRSTVEKPIVVIAPSSSARTKRQDSTGRRRRLVRKLAGLAEPAAIRLPPRVGAIEIRKRSDQDEERHDQENTHRSHLLLLSTIRPPPNFLCCRKRHSPSTHKGGVTLTQSPGRAPRADGGRARLPSTPPRLPRRRAWSTRCADRRRRTSRESSSRARAGRGRAATPPAAARLRAGRSR